MRRGRKNGPREDRCRQSPPFVFEEAVLDPELDVTAAALPTFERRARVAQRNRSRELNPFDGTIVEVEAGIAIVLLAIILDRIGRPRERRASR